MPRGSLVWRNSPVCAIVPRITYPTFGAAGDSALAGKEVTMEQDREKLIEEIGDLALQYDKDYFG